MVEVEKEYWVLLDKTEILGIFETLQECLCWNCERPLMNPLIRRVKKLVDGTFRSQEILIAATAFTAKIEQNRTPS